MCINGAIEINWGIRKFAVVEKKFQYKGHECICIFNYRGHRCGYVSVKEDIPFYERTEDCHCGLSFNGTLPFDYGQTEKYYIGFDCGHICDSPDFDQAYKYELITEGERDRCKDIYQRLLDCPVRDLNYVIENCKKIVDQIEKGAIENDKS